MTTQTPKDLLARALVELRTLKQRLAEAERASHEPIAVIGVGCRFPGGCDSPAALWRHLCAGADATGEPPPGRFPAPAPPDVYTRRGAYLDAVDGFDDRFFGVTDRELRSLDPQHRLLLEVCWEALEHAAIAPDRLRRTRTGVFCGISTSDWASLLGERVPLADVDGYFGPGTALGFAPGRVAYFLGLQGPTLAVDTACSSSLVAVHLACQSLRSGESDLALAAGVNLVLSPTGHVVLCRARVLSPDGRCKTFDAGADGYARGEGCGVVVLRRLTDALAAGDPILAVVRGSAVNQDGPASGLTVPNPAAQEAVIRDALARARIDPAAVDYVEAHGTGTALGDPIEARALAAALGSGRPHGRPLLLGTIKTNIGHLESAAGIAGLIKLVLSLHHAEIPRHLHLRRPTPAVAWDSLPLAVVDAHRPWPPGPRIAGVSSFGASGTNAHAILSALTPDLLPKTATSTAPTSPLASTSTLATSPTSTLATSPTSALASSSTSTVASSSISSTSPTSTAPTSTLASPSTSTVASSSISSTSPTSTLASTPTAPADAALLLLSAASEPALRALAGRHARALADHPDVPLAEWCATAALARARLPHALAALADDPAALARDLASFAAGEPASPRLRRGHRPAQPPRVAFVFSGQGARLPGGTAALRADLPAFRAALAECDDLLRPHLGRSVVDLLDDPDGQADTLAAQPALFALGWALAAQWRAWGVEPAVVFGHSLGEYLAACIAGVLRLADAAPLVARRAAHMQALARGIMVAVSLGEADVAAAIAGRPGPLAIAAINSPAETVLSGSHDALAPVLADLAARGAHTRPLRVSHAFHSPLMDPALAAFERDVAAVQLAPPTRPMISGLTGRLADADIASPAHWRRHMREPVRFAAGLAAVREHAAIALEIGPGAALTALTVRAEPLLTAIPSLRHAATRSAMLETLGELAVRGVDVAWSAVHPGTPARRRELPTYPFQRRRHWLPPARSETIRTAHDDPALASPRADLDLDPLPGRRLPDRDGAAIFTADLRADLLPILRDHRVYDRIVVSGAVHATMVLRAARHILATDRVGLEDLEFLAPLVLQDDAAVTVETRITRDSFELVIPGDAPLVLSRGRLATAPHPAPPAVDLDVVRARCREQLAGADFYARHWRPDEHDLGPSYRTIDHVWRRDGEALARLRPPAIDLDAHRGLGRDALLNTCIGEVYGQILMPAVPDFAAVVAALEHTFLGHAMAASRDHGGPARAAWARAVVHHYDGALLRGDVQLLDEHGAVLVEILDLRARRVPRSLLQHAVSRAAPPPSPLTGPAHTLPDRVRAHVHARVAALVGDADLDDATTLQSLGLDSLMAIDLHDTLRRDLGVEIPLATALQSDTLTELTAALLAALREPTSPAQTHDLAPPTSERPTAPPPPTREPTSPLHSAPSPTREPTSPPAASDLASTPPAREPTSPLAPPSPAREPTSPLAPPSPAREQPTRPAAPRPWLRPLQPAPRATTRVLAFPHGGAGPAAFFPWRPHLGGDLDVQLVQLPGRWERLHEPVYTHMDPLIADLLAEVLPRIDPPYVLLGVSFGALVAYELARAIVRAGRPAPAHLVVAAYPAPDLPNPLENRRALVRQLRSDDPARLAAAASRLGMIPDALLDPDSLRILLPALRADLELVLAHTHRPGPPLPLPITALGGTDDPDITRDHIAGWARHTDRDFTARILAGPHLFYRTAPQATLAAVQHALAAP